jgi:RNA polymerase sigma-70 factor, ECF subfamily
VPYPVLVDGAAGIVATEAGVPVALLAFTVRDGRIAAIDALGDPARIEALGLEDYL